MGTRKTSIGQEFKHLNHRIGFIKRTIHKIENELIPSVQDAETKFYLKVKSDRLRDYWGFYSQKLYQLRKQSTNAILSSL